MQPGVQLAIPQPCHENWHNMTPSQQGRFCSACAKEVVDFTGMSDTELLHYFLDKKNEKICGRIYPDQLNRQVTKTIYPKKKKFWYWNYAALLLLFISKSGGAKAQGQIRVTQATKENVRKAEAGTHVVEKSMPEAPQTKRINGTVKDSDGNPVAFATISIKGTATCSSADANGKYFIKANSYKDILRISAVGYETAELVLKAAVQYEVVLQRSKATLEGDIVVTVGGIGSEYDYTPAASAKHIAVIKVLDNATHLPVKAGIAITKNGNNKTDSATTDAEGVYKVKRIKEDEWYKLVISAEGYLDTVMDVKGWTLTDREESKYIFLETAPVLTDYKKMEGITVEGGPVCILRRETSVGMMTSTVLKKQTVADTLVRFRTLLAGAMKIAPNPVGKGNEFSLIFSVKNAGDYFIQITNAAGQLMQQQRVSAFQKNNVLQLQAGMSWSSGVYYLSLTDTKNNLLSTNSFIVQ